MISFYCTSALLKSLNVNSAPPPLHSDSALGDWFGDIFTVATTRYVIYTNGKTLLPLVTRFCPTLPLFEAQSQCDPMEPDFALCAKVW
jgi:hypothetical protein